MTDRVLAGLLLAGGRSTRFGADKALAEVGGTTLLARAAACLRDACDGPVLVASGDGASRPGVGDGQVADLVADGGPLSAIGAGLAALVEDADLVAVLAVDHVSASANLLRLLAAQPGEWCCAVAEVGGRLQPLHAVWTVAVAADLAAAVAGGERSVLDWLATRDDVVVVPEVVLRTSGIPPEVTADADTPGDLADLYRAGVPDSRTHPRSERVSERRSDIDDVMSAPVRTLAPSTTLVEAARAMHEDGIGAVMISEGARPDGILTERDLLRATAAGAAPDGLVGDWMTADVVTADRDTSPTDALERMSEGRFRHLPIVDDDGDVVGIVSIRDLLALARLEPVTHPGHLEAPKGLAGVIVAETDIGDVRGEEGFYHYRQYSATDLAEHCTLEHVWHLMLRGELPDEETLAAFRDEVTPLREIPERTAALLPDVANSVDQSLDGLRTAVSMVGAELGFQASIDVDGDELAAQALQITAVIPTLIMALYRLGRGEEVVPPDPDLPYAANYLRMMTGEEAAPEHARALEQYLISTIDHGFNASTFTARVITSTGADLAAAVTGAIGALSGPLHGGAPSRALGLLDEIGTPERADAIVRRMVEQGERIMGFGHRVYKTQDPRSAMLSRVAARLGGPRAELAAEVEQTVVDVLADLKPGRELYANVEYYAGVVFEQIGLPPELFTPTFTSSRTIGWCAHILEQAADNRLIRPTARYVGGAPPQPIPDHARAG